MKRSLHNSYLTTESSMISPAMSSEASAKLFNSLNTNQGNVKSSSLCRVMLQLQQSYKSNVIRSISCLLSELQYLNRLYCFFIRFSIQFMFFIIFFKCVLLSWECLQKLIINGFCSLYLFFCFILLNKIYLKQSMLASEVQIFY